ncbi:uncharacterized protein LOC123884216 isoform X5 [Trifolium pratense]|uniref:uncharacterized protein LOC123884216 isoform X5 n=1 Tax=Trifolium pratense TaxID=57577 RepID=UPI001E690AFA|nr:uncharacterized protein LOC123884216 isoform X5 [Trifolium pratense]XP_045789229.1 uncharacterized protein LOC123884216 isoform X5 [Trifolium pratense]
MMQGKHQKKQAISMETDKTKKQETVIEIEKTRKQATPMETEKTKKTTPIETQKTKNETTTIEADKIKKQKVGSSLIEAEKSKTDILVEPQPENNDIIVPVDDRAYDPVNNVNKKKEIWRLGVIVDDMWIVTKAETEVSIELLIRDIKGSTIQVSILENDIELWKTKLAEGKTYYMRNFRVHDNDQGFKMTTHKFRLTFVGATRVDEAHIPGIPKTLFNFKDFSEIQSGNFEPDVLVDAIGVIESIKKSVTATSTKKGNVAFTLKDLRDNVLDCTLWDGLSVEFINFYNKLTDMGPAVMIIKHARVKEPQGVFPLQLTNVWNGTKLLFDRNIPEIKVFQNSLPNDATYPSQSFHGTTSTQFRTQSSVGSQYTSDENFCNQARVIGLGDMKKLKADTYCVTVVTTSHIRVSNQGWFFRSCPDCSCRADGTEPPFQCRKGHQTDNPIIKYKLDVEVYDGDDTAKFIFWDSTLDDLVGMNAATLLAKEKKRGFGDPQEYPLCFDDLMERKFAFRVKWQPGYGGQASVLQCKDSKELVDKIQEQLPAGESIGNNIEDIEDEILTITEEPPIQAFTQSDIDKFAGLDDSILSTPNVSASADNDLSASSHKTPATRIAVKPLTVDPINLESQFSSTRSRKVIKKEKI